MGGRKDSSHVNIPQVQHEVSVALERFSPDRADE
jgi:hypothetical protein